MGGRTSFLFSNPSSRQRGCPKLTDAESRVLVEIVAGRSNFEIAHVRNTSPRTVANQVASILKKFGVHSRRELVALSLDANTRVANERPFTHRQRQVLHFVAEGWSNKAIAHELGLSIGSVGTLLTRAKRIAAIVL